MDRVFNSVREKLGKILLFLMLGISSFAATMLPMKFDKRIDGKGGYQEYQIQNPTNKTVRYRIFKKPEPKDLTDQGIVGSMDRWIDFYPKILTIPPRSNGIVKVAIKSPPGAKSGEYAARIGTSPVAIPKIGKSGEAINAQITLPVGVEMQIFGYVGEIEPKIEGNLQAKKDGDGTFIGGKIENNGTAGISLLLAYRYSDETGTHSKLIPLGRLMPGNDITIDTALMKGGSRKHKALELAVKEDGGSKTYLSLKP